MEPNNEIGFKKFILGTHQNVFCFVKEHYVILKKKYLIGAEQIIIIIGMTVFYELRPSQEFDPKHIGPVQLLYNLDANCFFHIILTSQALSSLQFFPF